MSALTQWEVTSASAGTDLCYTKINMTARKVSRKAMEWLVTQQLC